MTTNLSNSGGITIGTTADYVGQSYPFYTTSNPVEALRNNCTELYKQSLWYNIKTYGKDVFTEDNHKNMLSMLESNDKDTLELLRQILVSKIID